MRDEKRVFVEQSCLGHLIVSITEADSTCIRTAQMSVSQEDVGLLTGVTGPRARMDARVEGLISSLRKATDKAVCIGFGVSSPNQVIFLLPSPRMMSPSGFVSAAAGGW